MRVARTPDLHDQSDPMPARINPMLARPGVIPEKTEGWAAEVKWDGYRAAAHVRNGEVELISRNGHEISDRFPEIVAMGAELGDRNAIFDGEIVAFDAEGLPSFGKLQQRFHSHRDAPEPATFVIFDLLYLDGHRRTGLPYSHRRAALEELGLGGPAWQVPEYVEGDLQGLLDATVKRGLEGLILKRLESRYEPGSRSGAWVKIKNVRRQEFVIGGWLPGEGARSGAIGALLVGIPDRDRGGGALRYAGRVGTGFDAATMAVLERELSTSRSGETPFDRPPPPRTVHVRPELVAEVEFTELTVDGMLRHPSFKGLRTDRDPSEISWEHGTHGLSSRKVPADA